MGRGLSPPSYRTCSAHNKNAPELIGGVFHCLGAIVLEEVPEELVVYFVVILDFRHFDECAEGPRAAVGSGALQIGVPSLHVPAEQLRGPVSLLEIFERRIDVVREVAL